MILNSNLDCRVWRNRSKGLDKLASSLTNRSNGWNWQVEVILECHSHTYFKDFYSNEALSWSSSPVTTKTIFLYFYPTSYRMKSSDPSGKNIIDLAISTLIVQVKTVAIILPTICNIRVRIVSQSTVSYVIIV